VQEDEPATPEEESLGPLNARPRQGTSRNTRRWQVDNPSSPSTVEDEDLVPNPEITPVSYRMGPSSFPRRRALFRNDPPDVGSRAVVEENNVPPSAVEEEDLVTNSENPPPSYRTGPSSFSRRRALFRDDAPDFRSTAAAEENNDVGETASKTPPYKLMSSITGTVRRRAM
jgi:hypothetical protein